MRYILLLIILLTGCGTHISVNNDPTFNKYYDTFLEEGLKRGVNLYSIPRVSIYFSETLSDNFAGYCSWGEGYRFISINKKYWDGYSEIDREYLIFHELGHCVLGKDHDDGGVMSNDYFDWINYANNRHHYLDLLFKN